MKNKILLFFLLITSISFSQELRTTVTVNFDQINSSNKQLFKNLEKQMAEFLNNTKFSEKDYKNSEKIECSFFLNITSHNISSNDFEGTLLVQSSRPVYNSTYTTPVVNINDIKVGFRYIEFENLIFDANNFNSNLVSLMAYYANLIIGLDRDTFSELGGTEYLQKAANIVTVAQSSGYTGWSQSESNNNNRYFFVTDLLSNTFLGYRKSLYQYHIQGLDLMADNALKGKEGVIVALQTLSEIHKSRPNALLTRAFFDAKTDEVVAIFSSGPKTNNVQVLDILNKISPLNSQKWNAIK